MVHAPPVLRIRHMAKTVIAERLIAERLRAERVLATGTVKWSNAEGCGLIAPDEGDEDLFFRGDVPTVAAGTRVEFEVDQGPEGLEAFDVVPVAAPADPPPAFSNVTDRRFNPARTTFIRSTICPFSSFTRTGSQFAHFW